MLFQLKQVTELIDFLSLQTDPDRWAEGIKYANGYEHGSSAEIEASGYDIKAAARYLQIISFCC